MAFFYRTVAFLFFFIALSYVCLAQESKITGTFSNLSLEKFVKEIESKTDYHFYFNPQFSDSLNINASPQNQSIEELLNQVLAGTDFHHVIDRDHNIYISFEREILADLPDDFFGTGTSQPGSQAPAFDYTLYEKREKERKLVETKLYSIGIKTSNLQGK